MRRIARAALLVAGCLVQQPGAALQEPESENARDPRIAQWRESLELDLPGEVLIEGPALVSGEGRLRRDGEAVALVARALFAAGQETLAKNLLAGARPKSPAGAAHVAVARASFALAEDDLARVIRDLAPEGPPSSRYPDHPETWLYVGRAYARMGEPDRSDLFLMRFTELAPLHAEAPAAWHMRAQHAVARRNVEAAGQYRQRGEAAARWQAYYRARRLQVRERPDAPLPRLGLAQLWLEVNDLDRAHVVLVELVRIAPDFARGWSHLGEVERTRGAAGEAETAYGRALTLDPKNAQARMGRGLLRTAAGRLDEAAADFRSVVEAAPEKDARAIRATLQLARIHLAKGEESRARELYDRYTELGGKEPLEP